MACPTCGGTRPSGRRRDRDRCLPAPTLFVGTSPAATAREAVEGCVGLGVLGESEPYRQMVGFRNIVVHRYEFVNPDILLTLVNHHLDDFERFVTEVLAYVGREG